MSASMREATLVAVPFANQQARVERVNLMLNGDKNRIEQELRMADVASAADEARAANQAGRLTAKQQRDMAREISGAYFLRFFYWFALMFAGWPFLFFGLTERGLLSAYLALALVVLVLGYFALLLLILVAMVWRRASLLQAVRTGQLEHATGQIVEQNGKRRAVVPGRKLAMRGLDYPPGNYDFYFLARTGRVASAALAPSDPLYSAEPAPTGPANTTAEPQRPALTDEQLLSLRNALAATNHFRLEDLAAYREGKPGRDSPRPTRLLIWFVAALLMVLSVFWLVWFVVSLKSFGDQPGRTVVLAVFAIIFGILTLISAWASLNITLDVLGGKIVWAEGEVETGSIRAGTRGGTNYYYWMESQNLQWDVSKAASNALIEDWRYRVYYLPHSKRVVGIEPMAEG